MEAGSGDDIFGGRGFWLLLLSKKFDLSGGTLDTINRLHIFTPMMQTLSNQCRILSRRVVADFEPNQKWILESETFENEYMIILLAAPKQVFIKWNLIVDTIDNVAGQFDLVVTASFKSLCDIYRQRFNLQLAIGQQLNAWLLLLVD